MYSVYQEKRLCAAANVQDNVRLLTEFKGYIDNYTMSAEGTSGIISICPEDEVSNCIIHRHHYTDTPS